jgi:hypothetical protein
MATGANKSLQQPLAPPCAVPIQYTPSDPISFRSILMLSSYLYLRLPSGLFPSGFTIKTPMNSLLSDACYMPSPPPLIYLDYPNNIWRGLHTKNFLNTPFFPTSCYLPPPVSFSHTDPKILFRTPLFNSHCLHRRRSFTPT